ncbi:MAG TPA: NAD(P)/FAD-dependent oxidoreductase [Tepidisphaeraceae bacterium]|jgi:flavin-dependent dehydrogenase
MFDVTIIGAGPAGSVAACMLARAGCDVTLVEQARFPRDKVCGESLSALGVAVLTRIGLAQPVRAVGPAILVRTALHSADGRSLTLRLPHPMWGVSRRAMDAVLLEAARQAGACVRQPARCEGLNGALLVRDLASNRVETFRPTWVIVADGKGALLPDRPPPTSDFGVKAHFADVVGPRDTVELFGVRGHYVGLAPIERGLSNVAFSVPAARLEQSRGDLDALWEQVCSENPTLAARFAGARRAGEWLASPLPRHGVARRWPRGVIPLGNSAAALEPIGGEGMGLAMRSAELAAAALIETARRGGCLPVRRLRAEFDRLWRMRRLGCRALARLLSAPGMAGDAIDWGRVSESLTRAVMRLLGKG